MNGIDEKNLRNKPGWVRVSLHPTMNDVDVEFITEALREIVNSHEKWAKDYTYNPLNNEYEYIQMNSVDKVQHHFFGL